MKRQMYFFAIVSVALFLTQITLVPALPYYIPLVIIIGIYFLYNAGFKIEITTFLFLLATLISILVNNIPPLFNPWVRFALFSIVMLCVSPLNKSQRIAYYREALLLNICVVSSVIMLLNLVSYYGGFGQTTFVGFWGVCYHGNLLGVFSMIGIVYMLSLYLNEVRVMRKWICLICIMGGILILLLSSSRSCLACAFMGGVLYLKLFFRSNSKLFTIAISLIVVYILVAPFFEEFTFGISRKMSDTTNVLSITGSRDAIWATRLEEFRRGPLFGIGAFSVDTSIKNDNVFFNPYNPITGAVELGSTYFGILSQTGLLGFVFFIYLLVKSIKNGYRNVKENHSGNQLLVFVLLVMFSLHMTFEGYVNTAGQILTLILWLIIACNLQPSGGIENIENKNNILYY